MLYHNTVQYDAMQLSAVQYDAMQLNAVQYDAVQCNTVQYRDGSGWHSGGPGAVGGHACDAIRGHRTACIFLFSISFHFEYMSHVTKISIVREIALVYEKLLLKIESWHWQWQKEADTNAIESFAAQSVQPQFPLEQRHRWEQPKCPEVIISRACRDWT